MIRYSRTADCHCARVTITAYDTAVDTRFGICMWPLLPCPDASLIALRPLLALPYVGARADEQGGLAAVMASGCTPEQLKVLTDGLCEAFEVWRIWPETLDIE